MSKKKFYIDFEFEGIPLTKSNTYAIGNRRMFVPTKILKYENALQAKAEEIMSKLNLTPTFNFVKMTVWYFYGDKRKRDIQNSCKTTCDALNHIVFEDDAQIHTLILHKMLDRDNPRIRIVIEEMEDSTWIN